MDNFPQFHELPPELRFKIWNQALSAPCVWAAKRDTAARMMVACVGPPAYLAGYASYESRQIMRKLYGDPLVGVRPMVGSVCWVYLENSLVYLRDHGDVTKLLETVPAKELKRFRHIALGYNSYTTINLMCQRLASSCPELRTIIVFWDPVANLPSHDLTPTAAANLTSLMHYTGPYRESDSLDTAYFRSLLLPLFGDCQLRLHVVTHEQAVCLELPGAQL